MSVRAFKKKLEKAVFDSGEVFSEDEQEYLAGIYGEVVAGTKDVGSQLQVLDVIKETIVSVDKDKKAAKRKRAAAKKRALKKAS